MPRMIKSSQVPRTIALCYIRQSFTRDASDTESPERQRNNIQRICDKYGWTPEWYQDAEGHKSGTKESNRPGWLALKPRLADPDVAALVANDLSRLHRKSYRIGDLLDNLKNYGIRLIQASSGQEIDMSGFNGIIFAQMAAIFDEFYAADISRRAKDSINYRKSNGILIGIPPFGTQRNEAGLLEAAKDGAWFLPSGKFVAGKEGSLPPEEGAIWRGYYECAFRALTLYAENKHGWESLAYQMNAEAWSFKTIKKEARPFNKDDVRRIVRNWPEYGGIVLDEPAKERNLRELFPNPDELPFNQERAVFPLELLYSVAKIHIERSAHAKNQGVKRDDRIYPLNAITYCAHCEALAQKHTDPKLHNRLAGDKGRYRHKNGVVCGCTNKSVVRNLFETDFGQLIKMLTVRPEALPLMAELAIQADKGHKGAVDAEVELEEQKRAAIAQCRRRIEAAVNLYGDGMIDRAEYLRRKELNDREIVHWESRTAETKKAAIELALCLDAIDKVARLWDMSDDKDKQGLAHSLFTRVTYNLDTRRITGFELKPWADRFLVLRTALYAEEFGLEPLAEDMHPEGYRHTRVPSCVA